MGLRVGILFLLLLGCSWVCAHARSSVISDFSSIQINQNESKGGNQKSDADIRNSRICTLCEQFTAQAISYLRENKTQTYIIDSLHLACSQLHSYKKECVRLVDYYAPLFFLEVAMIQPEGFCKKVNLCDEALFTLPDSCAVCHKVVAEILAKFDDPESQLEILQKLLKVCDLVENYAERCKTLVFKFGPLILMKTKMFLEHNLCTAIHACKGSTSRGEAESSLFKKSLLSDS